MLPAVACWGATFCSFRGIGEGGTAFPRGAFLQGRGPLRPTICEGATPPLHSSCGSTAPTPSESGRSAPRPGFLSFHDERNQRRARGAAPGPRWGALSSPQRRKRRSPQKGDSGTDAEGFATLRWCGQLDAPSSWALTKRNILLSIRGSAGRMVASLRATLGLNGGIGEGGFWKRSGGNGGDGRRFNPIMSRIRNNLFIKFTASLEFVSGWFPVRFRLRFRNKWLNYAIYQPYGNEKLLFLLKKDL